MKKNIHPVKSQRVTEVFNSCGDWSKILVVPIDFGKREHAAQFCLGNGVYLLGKALRINNTPAGADYLKSRLDKIIKRHRLLKEHILIVSEDPPNYLVNFIHRFRSLGYDWMRVNAHEAKMLRTTLRGSSDQIDLSGITQALCNHRAKELEQFDEIYHGMKRAARSRRNFVRQETAAKNRIHDCVDVLLPGFLNERESGLVPFSEASLWLMEKEFSPMRISRMRFETLVKNLRRRRVHKPEAKASKLKALAKSTLPAPEPLIEYHQRSLAVKVGLLRFTRSSVKVEENEMARRLVRTPGFYLTSCPGVGVPLAGHIMGELGSPCRWLPVDNTASYAGIVCRESQTGGKDNPPVKGPLPQDCNHILRDYLLQAAHHVGTTAMPPAVEETGVDREHTLYKHHLRLTNADSCSRLGTAKKFLKVARCLIRQERFYMPAGWLADDPDVDPESFLTFFERTLEVVKNKWKGYDLSGVDPDENRLLKEEKNIQGARELRRLNVMNK